MGHKSGKQILRQKIANRRSCPGVFSGTIQGRHGEVGAMRDTELGRGKVECSRPRQSSGGSLNLEWSLRAILK